MAGRIRSHIRSNVIGYVALFVALGGSAIAANVAEKNSVVSKSIKKGAVKSSDVRNEGLRGNDVAPGAISGVDVADGGLSGSDVDESTLGLVPNAQEAVNAQTAGNATTAETADAVAPNAVTGAGVLDNSLSGGDIDESTLGVPTAGLQFVNASSANDSTSPKFATTQCPVGTRYIMAGFDLQGGRTGTSPDELTDVTIRQFVPNADGRRVIMAAYEEEPHAGNWQLQGFATCVNAP